VGDKYEWLEIKHISCIDRSGQNHFISFARFFVKSLEVVSKPRLRLTSLRSGSRARRKSMKKRSPSEYVGG
jgi:hypothetical protein